MNGTVKRKIGTIFLLYKNDFCGGDIYITLIAREMLTESYVFGKTLTCK